MDLYEQEKISLDNPMSTYIKDLKKTNKENLTIREMMTHRSSLQGWLKFYENTIDKEGKKGKPSKKYYSSNYNQSFSVPVAKNLFLEKSYPDTMRKIIYESELRSSKDYKYSDLGFYLVSDMVKATSGQRLDYFAKNKYYKPLGLQTMCFNPKENLD